jgi:ABC-type sugar transport system substrate-binding protein
MKRGAIPAALLVSLGMILTACGSDGDANADDPGSNSGAKADVDAATALIEPYEEPATDFPIKTPLKASVDGKKVAYLDCGTPVCGYTWTDISQAADILGIDLTRVNAGLQAETVTSAFDTVTASSYDGVLNPALPNPLAEAGLKALKDEGVPVVGGGVVNGDPELVQVRLSSEVAMKKLGELMAAYVIQQQADDANIVFYLTPELELTTTMWEGFEGKYKELCPDCGVRSADIPVSALGTDAPNIVSDDLQSHPDTSMAVFSLGEQAIGYSAAMKAAGIDIDTFAAAPSPDTLQQVKDGGIDAALGFDFVYLDWAMVDSLARLMAGEEADPSAADDVIPMQVLTKDDITDTMVQYGYIAFPDIADRFTALWPKA